MLGILGEKIGEGAFSDVHAWAPGQVVKLFKPAVRRRTARYEAHMTRAVFAAGGPAQEVLDEVTVDGRLGIVLPRLEGPTLLQLLKTDAITLEAAAEVLASLALCVHQTPTPTDALPVRAYMEALLQQSDGSIPDHISAGVIALIDRLPTDDRLSHCDLHPGNVIMTAGGPRLIDWTGVKRGGAPLDLACCHFLRTELVVESLGSPARQRALDVAVQSEYARLAGISAPALRSAVEAHLPIVRLFFLLGAVARPASWAQLLQRLDADVEEAN
ncbi:aminoglycoside phosphotransferase family protein [Phenylobacterium sp.]|jgi:streptomycin 6-kinase|uniref:aminoglycoside phosphotransferase family protein n=1 Tax=Phenylobacterium sp. TaxID=1871053 RepID=UPI002E34E343|nr:aminoglycoside phosphotransferase family protein [Phenylobacterium sp.]HEX3364501.1 aminoglycoside phosphotransferase family protein [Phenylobacterium sp.]